MRETAWLALVLALGCRSESRVADGGAGAGTGGTRSGAAGAGPAGAAGRGAGGAGGASGAGGFGAQCVQQATGLRVGVKAPGGSDLRLPGDGHRELALRGTVLSVESAAFSVEGCGNVEPPLADAGGEGGASGGAPAGGAPAGGAGGAPDDCVSGTWKLDVSAPGLTLPLERGAVVSVAYITNCGLYTGCAQELVVSEERAQGVPVLLAVSNGVVRGQAGWPVAVDRVDLGCSPPLDVGPRAPVTWALRVTGLDNPSATQLLYMGEAAELALDPESDERWVARNVDSFDLGCCDASTNLNYYVAKRL